MGTNETEGRLRDFIAWVRFRRVVNKSATVDAETLEIVAQGVERYLAGQNPWPKQRGNKAKPDLMWRCYWLVRFNESGNFLPQHKDTGGAYAEAGKQLFLSPEAVEKHVRNAERLMTTEQGRTDFLLWASKEKGATMAKFYPAEHPVARQFRISTPNGDN